MADVGKLLIRALLIATAAGLAGQLWLDRALAAADSEVDRSLQKLRSLASMRHDIHTLEREREPDDWQRLTRDGEPRYVEYFVRAPTRRTWTGGRRPIGRVM